MHHSHQRGSEIKFPLTVDPANQKMGTVYIHQPPATPPVPAEAAAAASVMYASIDADFKQTADESAIERINNDDEEFAITTDHTKPEPTGLRRRAVNFSPPNPPVLIQPAAFKSSTAPNAVRATPKTTADAPAPAVVVASSLTDSNNGAARRTDSSDTDDDDAGGDDDEDNNMMGADVGRRSPAVQSAVQQLDSSNNAAVNDDNAAQFTEGGTTSATEWIGITTNSEEENSYTATDLDASEASANECSDYAADCDFAPTVILNPCCGTNDRSRCCQTVYKLM